MTSRRTRLLASTMFVGISALSGGHVLAQTTTGQPAAEQEVVVTGSRIRQPNLSSTSPLTVVTDQEIKLQGAANIENLLNSLPQVTASQQSNVSNGATGTATVDLRDLGPTRTLVLVNGKRLMPGDPGLPVADLNNIPSAMVERVEVVTGGASAVYGADAVAGVVNFILKKDFQGAQIDAQYGFEQHTNDDNSVRALQGVQGISNFTRAPSDYTHSLSTEVSAIIGVNSPDGKGNVTAYATYRELQAIAQSNYDVSACSITATAKGADSYLYNGHACAGSSNSAYGRFTLIGGSRNPGSYGGTRFHVNTDGSQTFTTASVPAYNYAPTNYFQRPETRYTAGFDAHYKVNEHVDLYSDLMFADDQTVAQIAPSGLFAGGGPGGQSYFNINCNNPLLSAQERTGLCGTAAGTATQVGVQAGFRFAGFPRQDYLRHTNYKLDVGARGDLGDGWSYDAYLQYGTSIYNEHYQNDASLQKIQNALLVDPATGKCFTDSANCVPLNIFQYGKLTSQQLSYVLTPGFKSGDTTEQIANVSITGNLGQYGVTSPFAHEGVGVAFGTEYRRESLNLDVDNEFASNDLSGQGGATLPDHGAFDVYELFGEARVPLVQDRPFFKALNLDLGYRFSDYSISGITNTYKVEGDWAINSDVRLRGGYNRAVRAPNVEELFLGAQIANESAGDPCANKSTYSAGCILSFSTTAAALGTTAAALAAKYPNFDGCPASQCSGLQSGNRNLKPEKADTYTAGIVWTPTWGFLKGFTATVDYYNIKVADVIESIAPELNPQIILNECVYALTASACSLVHRDPSSGVIFGNQGYIDLTNVNGGFLKTTGYDVTANYRFRPTDWGLPNVGSLSISMIGTYVDTFRNQQIKPGPSYDCAGFYGPICGTPLPHWKSKVRFTYDAPNFPISLSMDWRYIGRVKFDANQGTYGSTPFGTPVANPTGSYLLAAHSSGVTDTIDERISAYNYFDFSGIWKVRPNLALRAGVANVFDKNPPVLDANAIPASGTATGNGNTYPGVYDSLGRTFFIGLTLDF